MTETMTGRVTLPSVRQIFVPDPGHVLFDVDLAGADAQVVAWEADDDDLKRSFRSGVKIHVKNATDIYGDAYTLASGDRKAISTPKGKMYDACKRRIHATNYGASARTLALNPNIGGSIRDNERFQQNWFRLHPGIRAWHRRVETQLLCNRTIHNRFGYRIIYFDRPEGLLPQALAWVPQSTVAEVCFRGALQLEEAFPFVQLLLQVHDSLVFQIPKSQNGVSTIQRMKEALLVTIPYDDPLVIRWSISSSEKSWGECEELSI